MLMLALSCVGVQQPDIVIAIFFLVRKIGVSTERSDFSSLGHFS